MFFSNYFSLWKLKKALNKIWFYPEIWSVPSFNTWQGQGPIRRTRRYFRRWLGMSKRTIKFYLWILWNRGTLLRVEMWLLEGWPRSWINSGLSIYKDIIKLSYIWTRFRSMIFREEKPRKMWRKWGIFSILETWLWWRLVRTKIITWTCIFVRKSLGNWKKGCLCRLIVV